MHRLSTMIMIMMDTLCASSCTRRHRLALPPPSDETRHRHVCRPKRRILSAHLHLHVLEPVGEEPMESGRGEAVEMVWGVD